MTALWDFVLVEYRNNIFRVEGELRTGFIEFCHYESTMVMFDLVVVGQCADEAVV